MDKDGNYVTKQPEYETVWAHGANCGIDDLDIIVRLDRMDDDFGLDTIEMGATIAVADFVCTLLEIDRETMEREIKTIMRNNSVVDDPGTARLFPGDILILSGAIPFLSGQFFAGRRTRIVTK